MLSLLVGASVGGLCARHDADDAAVALCQPWCADNSHCSWCKCRDCSLCSACTPASDNDVAFEGCESWCAGGEQHCNLCKCKGCDVCRGVRTGRARSAHFCSVLVLRSITPARSAVIDSCLQFRPDVPCSPAPGMDDTSHEDCQPWCNGGVHCSLCKCKGCPSCSDGAVDLACTPRDRADTNVEACQSWCSASNAASNCQFCKCRGCSFCPRCASWCRLPSDCAATACQRCEVLCGSVVPAATSLRCEPWCKAHHCGKAGGVCDGCEVCGAPQRPPPTHHPPPPPPPPHPPPSPAPLPSPLRIGMPLPSPARTQDDLLPAMEQSGVESGKERGPWAVKAAGAAVGDDSKSTEGAADDDAEGWGVSEATSTPHTAHIEPGSLLATTARPAITGDAMFTSTTEGVRGQSMYTAQVRSGGGATGASALVGLDVHGPASPSSPAPLLEPWQLVVLGISSLLCCVTAVGATFARGCREANHPSRRLAARREAAASRQALNGRGHYRGEQRKPRSRLAGVGSEDEWSEEED